MIKAIETSYAGYRFRSRLEARWAVFFDAAGINWVYEDQGYTFDGLYYLPDFLLPDIGYFEVKGHGGKYDEKLFQTFVDHQEIALFVAFHAIPDPNTNDGYLTSFIPKPWGNAGDRGEIMYWGENDMFLRCDGCGNIDIQNEVYNTIKHNCCKGHRETSLMLPLSAARSARFEHDEKDVRYKSVWGANHV